MRNVLMELTAFHLNNLERKLFQFNFSDTNPTLPCPTGTSPPSPCPSSPVLPCPSCACASSQSDELEPELQSSWCNHTPEANMTMLRTMGIKANLAPDVPIFSWFKRIVRTFTPWQSILGKLCVLFYLTKSSFIRIDSCHPSNQWKIVRHIPICHPFSVLKEILSPSLPASWLVLLEPSSSGVAVQPGAIQKSSGKQG